MEITLEKIELVKDRTGVTYKEAKEALELTDGNVVDAIIHIEESIDTSSVDQDSKVNAMLDKIKELIKKGNVSKLLIKKDEETVLSLPVNFGIIGTVLFPWAMVAGVITAFGTKCSIQLIGDNGEVVDVSGKATGAFETVVSKGSEFVDGVKDKGGEYFEKAKEAGRGAYETVKEKTGSFLNKEKTEFDFEDFDISEEITDEKEE